jgi:hypothetical protein
LSLDNIFVYINKGYVSNNLEFIINNKTYTLPNELFELKITNFENSTISKTKIDLITYNNDIIIDDIDEIENFEDSEETNVVEQIEYMDNEKKNINNEYIVDEVNTNMDDIKFFAKDILKENINIDIVTKNFLTKLIDMKNNDIENLINDEYFNEYEKKNNKIDIIAHKSKIYNGIRNINTNFQSKLNSENESMLGTQQKIKRTSNILTGGGEKSHVPPYKQEKNNPFKTNDERNTSNKKKEEGSLYRDPPILLEQKIYDTAQAKTPKPKDPPIYIPLYNNDGNGVAIPFSNMMNPAYNEPFVKNYNISLANPLHDFSTVSRIYEDIIPGDPRSFTFTTVYERYQLIKFMRNLINDNCDGEDMNIVGGKNTILSSIKLLDFNPYSLDKNPYLDLGLNFQIYRSAYPIRYNAAKHSVNFAKSAHGINVRLYNVSLGELIGNNINQNIDNFDFNLWRELKFYRYIYDEILRNKISPNFISLILRKMDKASKINWSKLKELQKKKNIEDKIYLFKKDPIPNLTLGLKDSIINLDEKNVTLYYFTEIGTNIFKNEFLKLRSIFASFSNITIIEYDSLSSDPKIINIINMFNITTFPYIIFKYDNKHVPYIGIINADIIVKYINSTIVTIGSLIDISLSSGESLVLLTEAPHSNIIKWASPIYEGKGSLSKMIATGFHKAEVWKSILFQLMHIMYTLQEENIYFEEFCLEYNIYIKDLYYDLNSLKYWIYTINGLDYYVPNYGYLVLFDSKYSDVDSGNFKIRSKTLFPDKNDKNDLKKLDNILNFDYNDEIFKQFKNIFEPSIFLSKLKKQGGFEPEDVILELLRKINYDKGDLTHINKIEYYFKEYFKEYLHNRIGTRLLMSEKEVFNIFNRPSFFKEGQLLIRQERYDEYKWVMFVSNGLGNCKNIITGKIINDKMSYSEEIVSAFSLFAFPSTEVIALTNISEQNIIERFTRKI